MSDQSVEREASASSAPDNDPTGNTFRPLPGEPGIPSVSTPPRISMSRKGLLALGLLIPSLVAVSAFSIQRFAAKSKKTDEADSKLVSDRPAAAAKEPRRLDMPLVAASPAASTAATSTPRVPALTSTVDEVAEPIGVRRSGQHAPAPGGAKAVPPEDAPAVLVSSRPVAVHATAEGHARRSDAATLPAEAGESSDSNDPMAATTRNLQGYQRQLQGLLNTLTKSTAMATQHATGQTPSGAPLNAGPSLAAASTAGAGLFGAQLQGSSTPQVAAAMLGNRSLTLPKGTAFTCALKTKVISATSGLVGCQVQRNVFSDDGRVLLIERGSHLDGEYRITSIRPGTVRIPVLWTRIRTPNGVTVDVDSPGTGQLGESGIDGYVDNRWAERIGAAMLLSLIDDSVKLIIQNQANESQADTIVMPSTTAGTSKLAEKVLDSTINIPPLIYQNQGGIVGIYVARDVDFSSVYELKPSAR
jgi:type IV secretion system protein VirB10